MKKVEINEIELTTLKSDPNTFIAMELVEAGFNLLRPITKNHDHENNIITFTQEEE